MHNKKLGKKDTLRERTKKKKKTNIISFASGAS
jgi:hypothetical protein